MEVNGLIVGATISWRQQLVQFGQIDGSVEFELAMQQEVEWWQLGNNDSLAYVELWNLY